MLERPTFLRERTNGSPYASEAASPYVYMKGCDPTYVYLPTCSDKTCSACTCTCKTYNLCDSRRVRRRRVDPRQLPLLSAGSRPYLDPLDRLRRAAGRRHSWLKSAVNERPSRSDSNERPRERNTLASVEAVDFEASLVFGTPGLNGFGVFFAALLCSLIAAEGFMNLIGAISPHYIIGIALGSGVYGYCTQS